MKIVFATNNLNKLNEVRAYLPNHTIVGLEEVGCTEDLAEDQLTLQGNAEQKAKYVFEKYGIPCFADDTGLLVDALDGAPGVFSARYAGPDRSDEKNMELVLKKMQNVDNRMARFQTVICYYQSNEANFFYGEVEGEILHKQSGDKGFGYDPIFQPNGYSKSFAEMSTEEKNKISHRGKAVKKLIEHLLKV